MLIRHALRNALLPATTVMGLQVGFLLGGALLVEDVFSWPGIGRYATLATTHAGLQRHDGRDPVAAVIYVLGQPAGGYPVSGARSSDHVLMAPDSPPGWTEGGSTTRAGVSPSTGPLAAGLSFASELDLEPVRSVGTRLRRNILVRNLDARIRSMCVGAHHRR